MSRSIPSHLARVAMLTSAICFAATATSRADDWNQFRGPEGTGRADNAKLPLTFSETENVVWKTPIWGKAWSSPVVEGDRIWMTTATEDGKKMAVIEVDFETGEVKREITVFENEEPQYCHDLNSYATPTPVVAEGRLYVHFGIHGTACLDTDSGKILWQRRDLECNHHRGPAASPIIYDDKLIVQFDGFDVQFVIAFFTENGETAWKHTRAFDYGTDNGDRKKAYCTPMVIEHAGQLQLIAPGAVATESLDPATGSLLWTVKTGGMNASARPVYGNGLVFVTNGMGSLTVVPPAGSGDITENIAWDARKGIPKKSSLLLLGDLLFMVSDDAVASCYNAVTGEQYWSKRLPGRDFAASPIYANGRIYTFSREGDMPVLAATKEFEVLAENKLEDGCMASPAVKGDALIVRTVSHLYRIENK